VINIELSDKILTNKIRDHHIVANSHLHMLNVAYPDFIRNYHMSNRHKLLLSVRFRLVAVAKFLQSIVNKKHYYSCKNPEKANVIFVSHLINKQQILKGSELYFGDLPDQLLKCNINSGIVLINHIKARERQALVGWKNNKVARFILSPSLDYLSEFRLYLSQKKSKIKLKEILQLVGSDQEFQRDVLRHQLSSSTFNTLRIAKQVSDVIQKTKANFIITTYEGHAWERLVFFYARKANPNIKCLGYQHSAVFQYQHAIKRKLGPAYDPDIILTSGRVSEELLNQAQLSDIDIACLGSPKHLTSSFVQSNRLQCCLVAPQGEEDECLLLFGLSLLYARKYKEQKFIWRLHPLLNFEHLSKRHKGFFKEIPDNVSFSNQDLEDDIKECDSVLYRGSTAVINAISSGLKPIYYKKSPEELNIDPIYQYMQGKAIVGSQKELHQALNKENSRKIALSLRELSQQFYTPLDVNILLKKMRNQSL